MDTIAFVLLLVGAIVAYLGKSPKVFIPVFLVAFIVTALIFNHHVTSRLDLSF